MRTHLVLSAGGMKTLSYAGAIHALQNAGVQFNSICACSGGTFFGACVAAGVRADVLIKFVLETDIRQFLGERAHPYWPGLASGLQWPRARYGAPGIARAFLDVINDGRAKRRDPTFEELEVPLATVALDLVSFRILVYSTATTPKMKVSRALEIATALPFLYPPHEDGPRVVVDGALVSQCPIWLALTQPGNCPIIALAPGRPVAHPRERDLMDFVVMMIEVGAVSRDLQLADQVTRALLVDIHTGDVQYDALDLPESARTALIAAGRLAAQKQLNHVLSMAKDYPDANASAPPNRPVPALPQGYDDDELAELGGMKTLALANALVSKQVRNQVFISYAHGDRPSDWLEVFRRRLGKYTANRVWDDSAIPLGEKWRSEIQQALERTKVALLLVDEPFLRSQFIKDVELFSFMSAREKEGLAIIPVLVGECDFAHTAIGVLQFANARPLDKLAEDEREKVFQKVERLVALALDEPYLRPSR